jgi:hypothetical protein
MTWDSVTNKTRWESVGEFILYATPEEKQKMADIFKMIKPYTLECQSSSLSYSKENMGYPKPGNGSHATGSGQTR